jgi:acyl carrier protein
MESSQAVQTKIEDYIVQNFFVAQGSFSAADSLKQRGIVDSTGVLELILFLQNEFNIQIQDNEAVPENFDTVNGMVALVLRKHA